MILKYIRVALKNSCCLFFKMIGKICCKADSLQGEVITKQDLKDLGD